jgi:hypothetical protein
MKYLKNVAGYTLKYQSRDIRITTRSDLNGFNVNREFGNNKNIWTGQAVGTIFHYITRHIMSFILKH